MQAWCLAELQPEAPSSTVTPSSTAHAHQAPHPLPHLDSGDGGGSNPDRLSRFSGTYSCTSIMLLTLPMPSNMAGWLGS